MLVFNHLTTPKNAGSHKRSELIFFLLNYPLVLSFYYFYRLVKKHRPH